MSQQKNFFQDDIQTGIQRSKAVISQIARGAASDRCVQILCGFITVALCGIFLMAAMGYDEGQLLVPREIRGRGQRRMLRGKPGCSMFLRLLLRFNVLSDDQLEDYFYDDNPTPMHSEPFLL